MATVTDGTMAKAGARFRPSFHLAMVLVMTAYVFLGFGITYLVPVSLGTRTHDSPIVHLHGIVFFSWMLLLVTQAVLVNVKNVRLHRSLGTFGIAVGTLVVTMGLFIAFAGASITPHDTFRSGGGPGIFFLSFVAPPSFAILFTMAIRAVKRPEVHRNLILMSTIAILMPGINRVYMNLFALRRVPFLETYLTMDVLLAAVLWHEAKKSGAISRASLIGAAVVVVPQLLFYPVSSTQGWADTVFWLGSFVHYE